MLRLKVFKEPYWLDIGMEVRLQVRPCTSAVFYQARSFMNQKLQKISEEYKSCKEVGTTPIIHNLEDPGIREALAEQYLTIGLARAGIIAWEGILNHDNDEIAEVTLEKIEELFSNYWIIAENFRQQYTGQRELLESEKNASGPSLNGTLEKEPTTALSVTSKSSLVQKAKRVQKVKNARTKNMN